MDLGLGERACLITGGSRGIGLQVARQLVAEGANVLRVCRGADALAEAARECVSVGPGRAEWLALDITAAGAADEAVEGCRERFGGVDVLVNNASRSLVRSLEELTDEDWQGDW